MYLNTRLNANRTVVRPGPRDMEDYCNYVKRVTAIHKEAVQRLVDCDDTNLLELAEMFEGIANLYLDISEDIRERFISQEVHAKIRRVRKVFAPLSATANPGEATEG